MGGGGQYPFPKEVWSPSGGWWSRPSNWRANTLIAAGGIAVATLGVWRISARNEIRHTQPTKPIPSANWSPQAREIGVRKE
ncbi:hypothetical protein HD553DRAFT_308377 [Filobasidium floriforme]|uniref:uncharacterized protein n=1 Tax=Filobasidium floriforme TaxID=5210 RepID=UPI001E8CF10B|nr:uncharacterized protein HD553DRAFT_308377 [Filobasidium floriforme]KAH8087530.1 hypothetical protein HD553DRAFT_308377 [Filobasidium floriforme]